MQERKLQLSNYFYHFLLYGQENKKKICALEKPHNFHFPGFSNNQNFWSHKNVLLSPRYKVRYSAWQNDASSAVKRENHWRAEGTE